MSGGWGDFNCSYEQGSQGYASSVPCVSHDAGKPAGSGGGGEQQLTHPTDAEGTNQSVQNATQYITIKMKYCKAAVCNDHPDEILYLV